MNLNFNLIKQSSYIDGEWTQNQRPMFWVNNPADGEAIVQLSNASQQDANVAVSAATRALPSWRGKTAKERSVILRKWYELIMHSQDDLAAILTAEQGKPLAEAKGEVAYGANYIEWFAEEAKRIYGDTIPGASPNSRIIVLKQGVGVVSSITPWNFPNAMITRKAAAALAAGCTFLVKPAAETPLSALALAELGHQAGIPPGVFNVIVSTDAQAIGEVLTGDSRIAKFSFTGSTQIGRKLLGQCADTVKRTSMELGGNAPFIVFNDADIDAAVEGAMLSKFRNAGQTCVCSNRLLVQSGVYEEFAEKLTIASQKLTLGHGFEPESEIGPLINVEAVESVHQLVKDAVEAGAQIKTGGQSNSALGGHFYLPTVLTEVTSEMEIAQREIFGPVAPLIRFDDESQAIQLANATESGLASYFYSRDIGRIWRVSEALDYGMIGINEGIISNEMAPFGGVKQSGIGREGSKYGLDDYLELKYLCMGGIE